MGLMVGGSGSLAFLLSVFDVNQKGERTLSEGLLEEFLFSGIGQARNQQMVCDLEMSTVRPELVRYQARSDVVFWNERLFGNWRSSRQTDQRKVHCRGGYRELSRQLVRHDGGPRVDGLSLIMTENLLCCELLEKKQMRKELFYVRTKTMFARSVYCRHYTEEGFHYHSQTEQQPEQKDEGHLDMDLMYASMLQG